MFPYAIIFSKASVMRLEIPDNNHIFVVSAPSGSGKTSLIRKALKELNSLKLSISHTTRHPRPDEIEGQDYYFVDKKTFRKMIEQNDFIEYALVYDKYYGTSKSYIENTLAQGHNVVMEIDWQGARQIRACYDHTFSIFILPPSLTTLRERLEGRAQDTIEVIDARMKKAISEAGHFNEYNYTIVNDDFERASAEFIAVLAGRITPTEITASRKLLSKTISAFNLSDEGTNNE